jgi:Trk K+ transport system NAD-binding subunit
MNSTSKIEAGGLTILMMGCGELAVSVATQLAELGHGIFILDSSSEDLDKLPSGKVEDGHITPLLTTMSLQNDLLQPSIPEPDVFIAITESDTQNALFAQLVQKLLRPEKIICRIEDAALQEMYLQSDIIAISGKNVISKMIVDSVNL